jgi:hypothetical protein
MKIEFDIFNREFFRTLMFSLKLQKKAQVSIIYMKHIVFLLPSLQRREKTALFIFNYKIGQ